MNRASYLGPILLAIATNASANPGGGEVVAGKAAINKHDSLLEIRQQTDRAVIEWKKFDIASHEHTKFVQPSKDSVVLNRVKSDRASEIMGKLSANGKVILVNPNGIRFGKDAKVDVNGLIASTSDIANSKFMEGGSKLEFDQPGNGDAAIINEGSITASEAGLVGLVAPSVMNSGVIEAKLGKVELASGDVFAVDLYGNNLLQLELSDKAKTQIIASSGTIEAGKIAITAAAAKELVDSLVVIAGELKAPVAKEEGGVIKISGGGEVIVAGKLDASNTSGKGGNVEVTGKHITLLDNAELDASGQHGGGDIKVGGDYLGQGNTPTAETTYVAQGATIYNDAIASGDGGRTIIWSDDTTEFHGSIYGRGGEQSGNGGFVETSGKEHLIADGYVDLTASNGNKGTYLLDPDSIAIYGNVDPLFVSTDSAVDLSDGIRLWIDAADRSTIMLTYSTNALSSATVDRTSANTLETTTNLNITGALAVGSRVRIGVAGAVDYANIMGADTFTISGLSYDGSKTIITTAETIPTAYTAQPLYRGLVSRWDDKSGLGHNTSQGSQSNMPLWVGGAQNGRDEIRFLGNDRMDFPAGTIPIGDDNYTFIVSLDGGKSGGTERFLNSGPASFHRQNGLQYDNATTYRSFWYGSDLQANTITGFAQPHNIVASYDNAVGKKAYFNSQFITSDNATGRNGGDSSTHIGSSLRGPMFEFLMYQAALSDNARNLLEQSQSANWDIELAPPGTGATEATKAMASDGYSVFASEYLEKLSQTVDIALQATNDITLDLQGDTLNLANNQNITLTSTAGNIMSLSDGTIVTNRTGVGGNIIFSAAGDINIDHNLSLDAQNGGVVALTAAGDVAIGAAGTLNLNNADTTIRASELTNAGTLTAGGTASFAFEQYNLADSLDVGDGGSGDVVVSDALLAIIKSNFDSYIFGRTGAADVTNYTTSWNNPVTFLSGGTFTNAATVTSSDDFTASADDVLLSHTISSSGSLALTASNGDIAITNPITLTAADINLNASGDVVTNNQLTVITDDITSTSIDGDLTWRSDAPTSASFGPGTSSLTFHQLTASNSIGIGTGGTPDVSISDAVVSALKTGFGSYTFGRSNGGDVTNYTATWDGDLTFLTGNDFTNAVATTSDSTIFANAGRDVALSDTMETISASANALTLVAGRNLVNNAGASALTADNSRWLVYSANVNNSTNASMLDWDFRRYGCSYSGGCTSGITVPATGNSLIYSTRPSLSIGATVEAKQVDGNANATLSNVVLNGVIAGDTVTLGPITAKFADSSPGKHKPVYVTYSLTTGGELGYFLQNNGLYGEIYAPFIADSVRWFSQNAERYKRDVVEATARKSTAAISSPKLKDMLTIEPNLRSLLRIEDLF